MKSKGAKFLPNFALHWHKCIKKIEKLTFFRDEFLLIGVLPIP